VKDEVEVKSKKTTPKPARWSDCLKMYSRSAASKRKEKAGKGEGRGRILHPPMLPAKEKNTGDAVSPEDGG
jgi:hypothetical protein